MQQIAWGSYGLTMVDCVAGCVTTLTKRKMGPTVCVLSDYPAAQEILI